MKIGVSANATTSGGAAVRSSTWVDTEVREARSIAGMAADTEATAAVDTAAANGAMVTSGATAVNTATTGEEAVAIITSYAALDTNAAAGSADTAAVAVDTAAAAATRGASIQVPLDT